MSRVTKCRDCGAIYGRSRSGTCRITDFAHDWVTETDPKAEVERLQGIIKNLAYYIEECPTRGCECNQCEAFKIIQKELEGK